MEGCPVSTVYYLLSGICMEHQTIKETSNSVGTQELLGYIEVGDCVGDIVGNALCNRRSSVTILQRSCFLCLDKDEWLQAMKKGNTDALLLQSLSSLAYFTNLPTTTIKHFGQIWYSTT